MSWNNLTIRTKLTIVFGSLALVALLAATLTFVSFNQINGIRDRILHLHLADKSRIATDNNFLLYLQSPDNNTHNQLTESLRQLQTDIADLQSNPLQESDNALINALLSDIEGYNQTLSTISQINSKRSTLSGRANAITQRVISEYPAFSSQMFEARYLAQRFIITGDESDFLAWEQAVRNFQQAITSSELRGVVQEYHTIGNDYWGSIGESISISSGIIGVESNVKTNLDRLLSTSMEVFNHQRGKNIRLILFFLVVIIIGSSIVSFMYSKSLSNSILRGIAFAERIASGDLTVKIDDSLLKQQDEIGGLARSLNNMGQELQRISQSVVTASGSIAHASTEFTNASILISKGANEQAASTEEISSSMEQMAANIDQNSDNAQQAESVAIETEQGVIDGVKAATEAIDFTNRISERITIIRDIAFQTNILALNAAVEAARAGEHGRGFAVVAAEVRKLAERASDSAQEIEEMTRNLKTTSDSAGQKLNAIIPKVKNNLKLIQEISAASIEQASGADQVNSSIQHLNQSVQENATASDQLLSNAQGIKNMAQQLMVDISFFKLNHTQAQQQQKSSKVYATKPDVKVAITSNGNDAPAKQIPSTAKYNGNGFELNMGSSKDHDKDYTTF